MKNLIGIEDFSKEEIDKLIEISKDIMTNKTKYIDKCKGKILATLFFEPSTRTRLSFESAMLSLGGNVIGFSSASNSSTSKGESLADTIKVVSGYSDIIAMRHPKEGAPVVAADNSNVPIINAGDGGHNHPTQTLLDLLTISKEKGHIDDLVVGLCGDLKYGRTVHSLVTALSLYSNIRFVFISPKELKMPEYVKTTILDKKGIPYIETNDLEGSIPELDVLYMTRIQRERFSDIAVYERLKDVYILDKKKLENAKKDLSILHPLPRVNEISVDVDDDQRACYFRQAENGRYMRMAIILKLLGEIDFENKSHDNAIIDNNLRCQNDKCITLEERGLKPLVIKDDNGKIRCKYCEHDISVI